jgi:hypothetical protein
MDLPLDRNGRRSAPKISRADPIAERLERNPQHVGGSGLCECLGLLSPAPASGVLALLRRDARTPIRLFRAGAFLRINLCRLLLYCGLAGKLEMPSMRPGIFPSGLLSQPPVWRALFSL